MSNTTYRVGADLARSHFVGKKDDSLCGHRFKI